VTIGGRRACRFGRCPTSLSPGDGDRTCWDRYRLRFRFIMDRGGRRFRSRCTLRFRSRAGVSYGSAESSLESSLSSSVSVTISNLGILLRGGRRRCTRRCRLRCTLLFRSRCTLLFRSRTGVSHGSAETSLESSLSSSVSVPISNLGRPLGIHDCIFWSQSNLVKSVGWRPSINDRVRVPRCLNSV
jgi:hypothetical protein